jgi:multidrug efflux pump subunit AcrB
MTLEEAVFSQKFQAGEELEQQQQAAGNMSVAFMLSMAGIFFLLVALFNSFSQPFLIMVVIPFGFTGVIVGYALQGMEMSMVAMIGMLGLAGVLINDSVVMIDNFNRRKEEAGGLFLDDDGIADGAKSRLRPILITSVTTVAGLAPAAYGLAGDNPTMTPIVMAMTWGVAFGTFVSLLLLPCLFGAEQDLRRLVGRLTSGKLL